MTVEEPEVLFTDLLARFGLSMSGPPKQIRTITFAASVGRHGRRLAEVLARTGRQHRRAQLPSRVQ